MATKPTTHPTLGDLDRLLKRFDALLAETVALRHRITAVLKQQPFWPDRRRRYAARAPERRNPENPIDLGRISQSWLNAADKGRSEEP